MIMTSHTVRCGRPTLWARLFGKRTYRIEIKLSGSSVVGGEALTVSEAWERAKHVARVVNGSEIITDCPFDDKGRPISKESK